MSTLQASELDNASRTDLISRAEALGIDKADVLTRAELVDEIVKRSVADPIERRLARGLLGVARDLVARVVERGLHLPDAAALIRGLQQVTLTPNTPPIATVTLAEIYAGQGHRTRALAVLDEVLDKEPEHAAARNLRERVAVLPEDRAPVPSSVPPPATGERAPDVALAAEPAPDVALAAEPAPDLSSEPAPDVAFASEPAADRERDTLPPTADASPTLVPTDLPTWHAPPDDGALVADRSPSLEPGFGVEADRIVLVPIDDTSAFARWEIGSTALDGVRARSHSGELILRIVAVTPSWEGPKVEIRDIEVAAAVGDWWVCDLPAKAVLRAALGWRGERGFDPLAVALEVAPSENEPVANDARRSPELDAGDRTVGIEDRARRRAEQGRPSEGRTLSSWRTLALAPWEAPHEEARPASIETH